MCRNIKPLFNFDPVASDEEIEAAALQFVRKISGYHTPSQINEEAFHKGVKEIAKASKSLLLALHTTSPKKNREIEATKGKLRSLKRFNT